jgi:hypothetical protein
MLRLSRFALFVCAASILAAAGRPSVPDPSVSRAKAALAQLPLRFEANQGQTDPSVRYTARAGGYTLLLTEHGPTFSFGDSQRVDVSLLNSNRRPRIEPLDQLPARTDYYLGSRENWRTHVANYSRVRYREVYPGVDVVYYGNQNRLEYDFVLQPGADPRAIRLQFRGAGKVRISPEGDLLVEAGGSRIVQKRPFIYQDDPGTSARREIAGRFTMLARNVVGLSVGRYDRSHPLVIDPAVVYGTYVGGNGTDQVNAVKVGPNGRLYIAGNTDTGQVPALDGGYSTASAGLVDIFVAVLDASPAGGFSLVYLTYLGGSNNDVPLGMDVDAAGFVYLTGTTTSTNFPLAAPFQSTGAGSTVEAFVLTLNPAVVGTDALIFSSYLGGASGDDSGNAVAADGKGMMYVIGTTKSNDFPLTQSAYQAVSWGPSDTFICQIDPFAGTLVYSTYLGGESADDGRAILVGQNGLVYFAASTLSTEFPLAAFNYSVAPFGAQDVIVGVMDMTKSGTDSLVYSTYFGGSGNEEVRAMAFDRKGNLVITGYTLSTDFPVTGDAMQSSNSGNADAFVAVVNPATLGPGFLIYSTYLGGAHGEVGYCVATDSAGYIYVAGYTLSSDFPIANAPQPAWGGGTDIFLIKFRPGVAGRSAINYSTYFGATGTYLPLGMAVGADGTAYLAGYGNNFLPTTGNAIGGYSGGASDGFVLVVQ